MIDIDYTIFIQLANFLIMWFLLNQILLKPIRGIIKKRAEHMSSELDAITTFGNNATKKLADYESALAQARAAGAAEREQLKTQAHDREQELIAAAQKDASATLGAARSETAAQAKTVMDTLGKDVSRMAGQVTAKILG
ncbi:H+transporting two-sector ATPase B/B' subunit [Desulfovibrio sp. X2]|uniref:ATP synthase F0 subunit B n=1 Tax=Desulfovibrio sp. X2 TaxID=941449 RepID=UPI000358F25A|nr:ATP synthase F0 subunit B [Desulfovibrio sp. X2]EPR43844.1 H+transporting two-sector ATPase B/B' subunit [Desulfovibrio sp. X2]